MNRTDPTYAHSGRTVDILLFEPFGAGQCSLQRHLLLRNDVHVAGMAPSTALLGALAQLTPPDVVVAHHVEPFALARALPSLRAEVPGAKVLAVHHGTAPTTPAVLRLAGAHRVLACDDAMEMLVPLLHALAASPAVFQLDAR